MTAATSDLSYATTTFSILAVHAAIVFVVVRLSTLARAVFALFRIVCVVHLKPPRYVRLFGVRCPGTALVFCLAKQWPKRCQGTALQGDLCVQCLDDCAPKSVPCRTQHTKMKEVSRKDAKFTQRRKERRKLATVLSWRLCVNFAPLRETSSPVRAQRTVRGVVAAHPVNATAGWC